MPHHNLTEEDRNALTRARLAAIVRSSSDAIVGETLDGIITDWNPAAERLYGYTAQEAIGQHVSILAPADLADEPSELLARMCSGESVEGVDTIRRTKNGRLIAISLTVSPIYDEAGQIIAASGIGRDITERKAAEHALAAAHQRTRQVLESITDGFFAVDQNWRITDVNSAAERMLGRTRDELRGLTICQDMVPVLTAPLYAALTQAMAEQHPVSSEGYYPPVDAWFEVRAYPSPEGLSVFFRDIGARKQLEQNLRASEAKYRSLVEHMPAVVYVQANDDQQTTTYLSPRFEALTGVSPEEALEQARHEHWHDFVHPDDRARVAAEEARSVASGEPFRSEHRIARRDGSYVWVRDECVAIQDETGQVVAWQGVLLDIAERIEAEQALAASEIRFRTAFENAPIGMALVRPDRAILQVNRASCAMLGYTEEELLATTFLAITHPDDVAPNIAYTERMLAGEIDTFEIEKRYIRKDGQVVWAFLTATLVRDDNGTPRYFISQTQDITARKAAETALASERDLLRTLMDHVPDAVYVKDTSSRFLHLNPATAHTLGIADTAQALGKTDFDFFPEALASQYFADEQRVIATGEPVLNRLEPQGEDEAAEWWLTSTVPLRNATGSVVGVIGSGRDITERLRTEEALQESESRLRALLAALPDLMFRIDRSGAYLDYKADRLDDLVLSPEAFLGRTVAETLPADVAEAVVAAVERVLDSGGTETLEYALDVIGGHGDFEARLVAAGPNEIVAVVRNVTERKQAEADLRAAKDAAEKASQLKSAFLSTMSHELRTPLTAISGYTELLQRGQGLTPDQAADVAQISRSADHLLALVGDLLDLSRIEVGAMDLRLEPVVLARIVEETLAQLAPQAASKGLALKAAVPADLVLKADHQRLRQILLNLIGNGVKFTAEGEVCITAESHAEEVAVIVSDTGIGIAPEALTHIFEEFRQADNSMTRRFGGAGLGLAIARKLAELHGGAIIVTSQPGVGSTFTLHLPT